MRLLLDTHVLLWQFRDDPRFTSRFRDPVFDRANSVFVSDVSVWEVVLKIRSGKLRITLTALEAEIERNGFARLAIAPDHLRELMRLPAVHRDPFDHLLIAQAIVEDMAVLSADRWFAEYPVRLA